MAVLYPSCVVKLALNFDEQGQGAGTLYDETDKGAGVPSTPGQSGMSRSVEFDPVTIEGRLRNLRKSATGPNSANFSIIPMAAEVECNSVRCGDKVKIDFDFMRCPVDARTVRSCLVEVYLGCVSPTNFSKGMGGWRAVKPGQSLASLVMHNDPAAKWLRFLGYADTWESKFGKTGSVVTIEARDLTSLYIDTEITSDELRSVRLGLPISNVLNQIVSLRRATLGTPIAVASGYDLTVKKLETLPRDQRGADGRQQNTSGTTEQIKMWDAIVDLCGQSALVPYIDRGQLIVRPPNTLFDATGKTVRQFVYGRNCEDLSFKHRLGAQQSVVCEYRCQLPAEKKEILARWPVERVVSKVKSGGRVSEEKIITRIVYGIADVKTLQAMARQDYEMQGRQEVEGSFVTYDVGSYVRTASGNVEPKPDQNADPDILTMRTGDPIEINFAKKSEARGGVSAVVGSLLSLMSRGASAVEQYLKDIGFDVNVARIFAKNIELANKTLPRFYVRNIRYNFTHEGITTTVDFMNAIQHRQEKQERQQKLDDFAGGIA